MEGTVLGIDEQAEVLSITSCPPLAPRPSDGHRLVTGKYTHSAGNVIDLDIAGLDEPIGTTANHPFWSADREEFVQAGSLQIGEHILSLDGSLAPVTQLSPRLGTEPVYNLETETEHVYYVSKLAVLVHNAGDKYRGGRHSYTKKAVNDGLDSHHMPSKDAYSHLDIDPDDMPAIQMRPGDHRDTASYGSSLAAQAHRQRQRELIDQGRWDDAIQMDIDDLRQFGDRYDEATLEMIDDLPDDYSDLAD